MEAYVTPETINSKVNHWLEGISAFNTHKLVLNPIKSTLLVIDMQRFFLDPASPSFTCGGLAILPNLRKLVKAYRSRNLPVIYTRHVHHPGLLDAGIMGWWWEGMCLEGTPESEVHPDLPPNQAKRRF